MTIADLRREYGLGGLNRSDLAANPLAQFNEWFGQASGAQTRGRWRRVGIALYKCWQAVLGRQPADVNAAVLATVGPDGQPSARTILLKGADERGFIFFTNYDSRKGRELAANPRTALVFYWSELERQVCVTGTVSRLPPEESAAYFRSRPRGSRLAAWASNQSEVIANRSVLEEKWRAMAAKFPGDDIPLPPNWGGYAMAPEAIEFWQGRPDRLHDRFRYARLPDQSWRLERLCP